MAVGNTIGKLTTEPMLPQTTPAGSGNPAEKKSWWSKWGDVVHTGLDILGAVPVIGIVADGANAAIYAAEGDYVNAAISGASAAANLIPGGGAAMKAGKAAVAVGKQVTKTVAKEGAEALAKKAAKEAAEKAAKEAAEKAAKKEAAEKAAKKAGSDAGGGVKGKGKKPETCKISLCVGKPVNPVLGIKFLSGDEEIDFDLPAPLPLIWQRSYFSDQQGNGWLGQGWSTPLSIRLLRAGGGLRLIDEQGRTTELPELDPGEDDFSRYEGIWLRREDNGRYRVSSRDGAVHHLFAPLDLDAGDVLGERASYLPLVGVEDRNGNLIRVLYDAAGLPAFIQDSAGRLLGLRFRQLASPTYGTLPRLSAVVLLHGAPEASGSWPSDRMETLVQYDHDDDGDLVRVSGRGGRIRREFAYRNHVLVQHGQPGGLVCRYEYDQYSTAGKVILHETSVGQRWRFDYTAGETQVTDVLGRVVRYRFDAEGELTGVVDASGGYTRVELDAWGQPTAVVDPANHIIRYYYDGDGNRIGIVDPLGARTEIQYHEHWQRPTVIADASGNSTQFTYDAAGNLVAKTDALGNVTRYNHDERGLVTRVTDAHGGRHRYQYDAYGQVTAYTDCLGRTTRYRWDAYGRQLSRQEADGAETHYSYDAAGNLQRIAYADNSSESYTYDEQGRLTGHVDAEGASTRWELAADGLPLQRINALGQRLAYQYDSARRLVVLTNETNNFYRFAYDANDNVVAEQGFDGRTMTFGFDTAGRLVERRELGVRSGSAVAVDADNAPELLTTHYLRDASGRVVEKVTGRAHDKRVLNSRFTYDAVGRVTMAVGPGGRTDFGYDALGQLIEQSSHILGHSHTVQHRYDALGNRVQTILPGGEVLAQHFHGAGYLHRIELDGKLVSEIERDAMQRETVRSQGALTSYFDYDIVGRRVGQRARKDSVDARDSVARQYLYGPGGHLVASTDLRFGQSRYQYDALGRLVRADNEKFSFDPAHNLVGSPGETVRGNRVSRYDDKLFVYDTHGNLAEKRVGRDTHMRLSYDPDHQLESAEISRKGLTQQVRYGYDALGRRIWKRDSFGTTQFVWDGDRLLQEIRHSRCLTYVYEPDSFVPLAQVESAADAGNEPTPGAAVRYFHTDQIGTPRELSDADGSIRWRASYRAWGNTLLVEYPDAQPTPRAAAEIHQPLRFQGQYFDAETGLHYNRFRYYDPDIGRFVSQDPLSLFGGYNAYTYAPNPLGWTDPLGLSSDGVPVPTPTGKGAGGKVVGPNIPGGKVTGLSTGGGGTGITNPAVQEAYDKVPKKNRSLYHGKCCEGHALSDAANTAGVKTLDELKKVAEGAVSTAYNSAGRYLPPCSSCKWVLNLLGVGAKK